MPASFTVCPKARQGLWASIIKNTTELSVRGDDAAVGPMSNYFDHLVYFEEYFFTARCYASAVLAMGLCPYLSVTSRCSIETAERIELVFGM